MTKDAFSSPLDSPVTGPVLAILGDSISSTSSINIGANKVYPNYGYVNWLRAHSEGCAAPVVLASTHERTLDVVPLDVLEQYAVDVPDDLGDL